MSNHLEMAMILYLLILHIRVTQGFFVGFPGFHAAANGPDVSGLMHKRPVLGIFFLAAQRPELFRALSCKLERFGELAGSEDSQVGGPVAAAVWLQRCVLRGV